MRTVLEPRRECIFKGLLGECQEPFSPRFIAAFTVSRRTFQRFKKMGDMCIHGCGRPSCAMPLLPPPERGAPDAPGAAFGEA